MLGRVTFYPIDLKWKDVVQVHVFIHKEALIRPLRHLLGGS